MKIVYPICCGVDVHKSFLVGTIISTTDEVQPHYQKKRFSTYNSDLHRFADWLHVAENGCKWRALPKSYGNWHTIYMRMNRWSKNGVLERVFTALQTEGIIRIDVNIVCLDSTSVKVHPDGIGALKKTENRRSEDPAEDLPRRFIWLPLLTDRLSAFPYREEKDTISWKE